MGGWAHSDCPMGCVTCRDAKQSSNQLGQGLGLLCLHASMMRSAGWCVCVLDFLCKSLSAATAGKRKRGRPARSQVQPEPSGDGADGDAGEDEDGAGEGMACLSFFSFFLRI